MSKNGVSFEVRTRITFVWRFRFPFRKTTATCFHSVS